MSHTHPTALFCFSSLLLVASAACVVPESGEPDVDLGVSTDELASVSCGNATTTEMNAAMGVLVNNWSDVETYVANEGYNLGSCIYNRLNSNGSVVCRNANNDSECDGSIAGYASANSPLTKEVNVCSDWTADIRARFTNPSGDRRKVCYGTMVAPMFHHTCFGTEANKVKIMDGMFKFLRDYYGQNMDMIDCYL